MIVQKFPALTRVASGHVVLREQNDDVIDNGILSRSVLQRGCRVFIEGTEFDGIRV